MAFNKNTFPIISYQNIVDNWITIDKALDGGEPVVFIPVGDKQTARSLQFLFHRVRSAVRAQKDDGYEFDYITVQLIERTDEPGQWGLKFTERGAFHNITLFNRHGDKI